MVEASGQHHTERDREEDDRTGGVTVEVEELHDVGSDVPLPHACFPRACLKHTLRVPTK